MPYRSQSEDTPEEIDRLLFDRYRAMSGTERVTLACRLTAAMDAAALAGLAARHPDADEQELRLRLFVLKVGDEVARPYLEFLGIKFERNTG